MARFAHNRTDTLIFSKFCEADHDASLQRRCTWCPPYMSIGGPEGLYLVWGCTLCDCCVFKNGDSATEFKICEIGIGWLAISPLFGARCGPYAVGKPDGQYLFNLLHYHLIWSAHFAAPLRKAVPEE